MTQVSAKPAQAARYDSGMVRCGRCKRRHDSPDEVRDCYSLPRQRDDAVRSFGVAEVEPYDAAAKESQRQERLANPTPPELLLWERLRDKQIADFSFEREAPIMGWVVDFLCADALLVVEVDGGAHDSRRINDQRRDEVLSANHYRVLRFAASQVVEDTETVVAAITKKTNTLSARKRREWREMMEADESLPNPWDKIREQKRAREARKPVPPQKTKKSNRRVASAGGAQKAGKWGYRCRFCDHEFVAAAESSPQCWSCRTSSGITPVCRSCGQESRPVKAGKCFDCVDKDEQAHSVAVESAGPGAHGPDGFVLKQSLRGKVAKPRKPS